MTSDASWAPDQNQVKVDPVGTECYGRVAVLIKRPDPVFDESCFRYETRPVPTTCAPGTVIVEASHISMDPTHFIWTQDIPQYMPAVGLETAMRASVIGTVVVTSDAAAHPVGEVVSIFGGVATHMVIPFAGLNGVVPGVPTDQNLGPFSLLQGHTAWVGFKICQVKAGETLVVSGAAGAVGSMAAQLGKMAGARVIGIAGGKAKCDYCTGELGLDGCIDYKTETVEAGLRRLCPAGVDCFFDNVGGPTLDAVVAQMNNFGRIAICGSISQYEGKMGELAAGFKNVKMLLMRRLSMQGFVCVDHMASIPESFAEIGAGLAAGTIKWKADLRQGTVDDYVKTVTLLLLGGNDGKLILKL
ncbi:hypothetical protein M885DRAFT_473895 [Pelagophyceae sp. CCMP2097]|nr:hypothetical protein M885DRAFT_473895 [Pelagophyceae sp. CCMP2097]